ncbi:MAG: desulfoferrodoxin family protein [Clostridia bacterium]|nr:desulfoferrodoxin family protein [Clostridia bacterium]
MKELEFYKCEKCGKQIFNMNDTLLDCCDTDLVMLEPNTVDAAVEKHMPVATFQGEELKVKVGEVAHPMTKEHLIDGIYIITDNGILVSKVLTENDVPEYTFKIDGANKVDVYVSCNKHGIWKATFNR